MSHFEAVPGHGVEATVAGRSVLAGNGRLLARHGVDPAPLVDAAERASRSGTTPVLVAVDGAPETLDDVEELLRPYGIVEIQRTGRVALPKLERTPPRVKSVRNQAG